MRSKLTYISIDMKKLSLMNNQSPKTMRQLILSAKFPHHEVRSNYGILRSVKLVEK